MALEDVVYVLCEGKDNPQPICGWVVSLPGSDAVLATSEQAAKTLAQTVSESVGSVKISFIRVPQESLSLQAPLGWTGAKPKDLPSLKDCLQAWKKAEKGSVELESSGAEVPKDLRPAGRPRKSLKEDIKGLQALFGEDDDEEDETDDEEEPLKLKSRKSSFLPPGSRGKSGSRARSSNEDEAGELDVRKLVRKGLAEGQPASELMPLMLMSLVLDKKEGRRRRKSRGNDRDLDLLGSSDSEDSVEGDQDFMGKGMKAVSTLHRLHENIRRRPRRIIQQFEAEFTRELGVLEGQPWTLRDWVKRQPWSKFKGLQRSAVQDVAVYEMLRNGESQPAMAQLVQNLKSKVQCILQQGDWSTAWLLTGIEDPLTKREFAGSKQEMAVVSAYVKALSDLKKKVKESTSHDQGGEEDGDAQASSSRK